MNLVSILLDIGNIIFFLANLPQIVTAFKHRKDLRAISSKMLIGFTIAGALFATAGFLIGAWIMCILNLFNIMTFGFQLYWKRKYKK